MNVTKILTIMVFAVVVVHDALIAEGFGLLTLLAGADGVQRDGAAVVHARFLAGCLRLHLLQVRLVRTAGYGHDHQRWKLVW